MAKDSTGKVQVDPDYKYKKIDANTPRGQKLILINKSAGVAIMGVLQSDDTFFTHYACLPTFEGEE